MGNNPFAKKQFAKKPVPRVIPNAAGLRKPITSMMTAPAKPNTQKDENEA
jgi:hypothetical protein